MNVLLNLWLIPLLPLLGAAINGLVGRRLPKSAVSGIALGSTALALAYAVWVAIRFLGLPHDAIPHVESYGSWITAGSFSAGFTLYLDQLSLLMLLIVTGVGFLIHVYSVRYMAEEGGYYRFFSYLNLFMFFMLTLVLAGNYLLMFVGWEGVGLASYLLIGFYFRRDSAASAGKKAFVVNRIGDFGFIIALFLLIKHFGSLDFGRVFSLINAQALPSDATTALLTTIALLLLVGACGKSAQIPLYVWLPDAMEGPTPVSALIHAATMVTAGVYMIARSHAIFDRAPAALIVVGSIGAATALLASTIAVVQHDIKRVLAYSTISQLGYMVMACGVTAYSAAMFHLMTHAFFKALLFLAAGSVIHALGGEQDMRKMGGLRDKIPVTFWTMTAGVLAITGAPFFSGFFSKDEILWRTDVSPFGGVGLWLVGWITAGLTSYYMFRLWFLTFFGEFRGAHEEHAAPVHAAPPARVAAVTPKEGALVEVDVPIRDVDAVTAELMQRDARALKVEEHGERATIRAELRTAKLMYFEAEVREMTEDRANVSVHFAQPTTGQEAPGREEHKHEGHVHESPRVMLVPLVILAVLSVIGGYVGVPAALGGSNRFEHFLEPVFGTGEQVTGAANAAAGHPFASELTLSALATLAAAIGFARALYLYWLRRGLAERLRQRFAGIYKVLSHKYYVDELYNTAIVQPIYVISRDFLWRALDVGTIDAAVNETAVAARAISDRVRRMQSGNIRSYAGWVAAGAAAVLIYMIVVGVR
jgi:proton-translocating NADH-quinone oxidoreductase chain L